VSDDSGDFLLDKHNHWIVDHDLFNHDGLTEDGIAEAFIEFAKKENLSFFEIPPANATSLIKGDRGGAFDAVKYQQLMDRLEAVELSLSEVLEDNDKIRIDSEYFKLEYLSKLRHIKELTYRKIEEFAYVTDGIHESIQFDENSSINLISAKSPKDNIFDLSGNEYISQTQHIKNPRTALQKDDVIISTVGTIGNCAVVDETILPANSDRHVGIVRIEKDFKPYFLSTFILSKYGRFQTLRESTGNVQLNLFIYKIKTLKIPFLSNYFQLIIQNIVKFAHELLIESQAIYQQAEDLLLKELGLKDWQPTEESIAVKSFSESFLSSGRLDAEYYQPKYDQVEEAIQSCSFHCQRLGTLIEPILNGFDYRDYTEEGTPYIRVGDIKNGQINIESTVKIPITISDVDKSVGLQVGDILFTRKGSFGNSAIVTELEIDSIISSEIMLLRLTLIFKQEILPEYVSLFLNSKFGYLQVERRVHGVAYYSISQPDLANVLIPILPKSQQQKIVDKIKSSFLLKQKSKQLLEIAKIGVEKAIETDEETATAWINQQLESLGVNLI
jgi:type I restriction enzyme M protein